MGILVLLLILEKHFQLFPIEYDISCVFVINGLYSVEICFVYSNFDESFYHGWVGGRAGDEWARPRARCEPGFLLYLVAISHLSGMGAGPKLLEQKP